MPYSVLIVDDSSFFQSRLKSIINECPDLEVVGVASNGREAIELTKKLKPSVVSMDYEMPFLDGISAVRAIMQECPTPIVMFSSMTYEGARITLDALEAGAVDFMNKNFAEVAANSANFKQKFHEKLITFAKSANPSAVNTAARASTPKPASPENDRSSSVRPNTTASVESRTIGNRQVTSERAVARPSRASFDLKNKIKLVVIGASTGGPVALAEVICNLPANFPAPILIVQHMPENFTAAFAERLNRTSPLRVKEAVSGDPIEKGLVLVAPGGKQMMVDKSGRSVKIIEGDERVNYKPCVDITFASVASNFSGKALAMVLTGMGSDGTDGARLLKAKGAVIWCQDKDSSVVYGMPAAISKANLADAEMSLKELAEKLRTEL